METISIALRRDVFEKLQKLAVPLVDDPNTVVGRLISHWEKTGQRPLPVSESSSMWKSARGETFPVGAPLRSTYQGREYRARVTAAGIDFEGRVYDSPSAAARAVKKSGGAKVKALHTNGWDFWEMLDPQAGRWICINQVRHRA